MPVSLSVAKPVVLALGMISLSGCFFSMDVRDSGPSGPVDVSHIPDAVPRVEPRSPGGNKSPYTVLGKTYHVMPDSKGYVQKGTASWYGQKFHGRRTSNGEIYNMYGMTAAHKSLPIPTYVQVTNLSNGRQVVVRVNDRGPFHGDRLIDLSYSAAKKLGFANKGTAKVKLVVIDPSKPYVANKSQNSNVQIQIQAGATKPAQPKLFELPDNTYLQAGAFSSRERAEEYRKQLLALTEFPVDVSPLARNRKTLFRVKVGPIVDNFKLQALRSLLKQKNLSEGHIIYD
ncbi:MAG: septal ring lytic transglycosylase RlpA family protein [Cellvibrionaceae bacterium]